MDERIKRKGELCLFHLLVRTRMVLGKLYLPVLGSIAIQAIMTSKWGSPWIVLSIAAA